MGEMNYTELDWREAILLGAALRDGLLHAVADEPRSAEEVADGLDLDGRAVYVALTALADLGLLDEGEDGFRLREEHRRALLDADYRGYVGESVIHRFELIGSWSHLPEILRSGEPVEDRTRPNFGGTATFIQAMRSGARSGAEAVAGAVLPRLPEGARILDVGGGPGTNAETFAHGGARVTVFDRPEVIEQMRDVLAASGIAVAAGDMNEGLPP
ncbi:MAG: methyltransferase, partial [Rubrobacteraceae bacterium]